MREIKFRGRRVDNGEWVYGLPVTYFGKTYILVLNNFKEDRVYEQYPHREMWSYEVLSETVGQFTGLKDKNGKEIYDGDVVVFENVFSKDKFVGRVMYYSGCKPILCDGKHSIDLAETNEEDLEVIGNIHDNPEMVEVNNENNNN